MGESSELPVQQGNQDGCVFITGKDDFIGLRGVLQVSLGQLVQNGHTRTCLRQIKEQKKCYEATTEDDLQEEVYLCAIATARIYDGDSI